jgi:hypothetical protein
MEISAILHELTHAEGLPEAAIRAAGERRSEVVPVFLDTLERFLAADPAGREGPSPVFFIFHMLGDYREKSAYRPLARLLSIADPDIHDLLGDGVTATSHRVMAAVFDGDPRPLYEVIECEHADQFVRSRMFETLAMLVLRGELDRATVAKYLLDSFATLRPQRENYVWHGWQSAIAMLGLSEFSSLVKKAFDRGFIGRWVMRFEHFQDDLKRARASPDEPWGPVNKEFTLFGDTIAELSRWHGFSQASLDEMDRRALASAAMPQMGTQQTLRNPFKGVGRNGPCPCGSGKKFKKCCLNRPADQRLPSPEATLGNGRRAARPSP